MNFFTSDYNHQGNCPLTRLLCIGLVMQGLTGCSDRSQSPAAVGEPFPLSALDQLTRINHGPMDTRGKTLLINFWATWCAPCRGEMPDLQKLSDALDPELYAVIGVSVDEDSNLIREFLLQYDISFQNYQDAHRRLASELLGIEAYPASFIVSPQGIIHQRIIGVKPWDRDSFQRILEQDTRAVTFLRRDWMAG